LKDGAEWIILRRFQESENNDDGKEVENGEQRQEEGSQEAEEDDKEAEPAEREVEREKKRFAPSDGRVPADILSPRRRAHVPFNSEYETGCLLLFGQALHIPPTPAPPALS
jgi:hypothetical protein